MPWANLDDRTWTDPVLGTLTDRAYRLHINAYAYCGDQLTDGRIDARQVAQGCLYVPAHGTGRDQGCGE